MELSLLDSLPSHIVLINAKGEVVYANKPWMDFISTDSADAKIVAACRQPYQEVFRASRRFSDSDFDTAMQGIEHVLKGEQPRFRMEHFAPTDTGDIWFLTTALPAKGKAEGVVVSHFEITDRKLVELEKAGLDQIFESSLNEIYVFDATTLLFLRVNVGARRNLGYTLSELRNMTPLDIKPECPAADFSRLLDPLRHHSTLKIDFTTVHQRKDGTRYPVEVHIQKTMLGEREVFFAIILDLTERSTTSRALSEARRFIDLAPDAMLIADEAGKLILTNSQAETLFGYSSDEFQGMNVEQLLPERFRREHAALRSAYNKQPRVRGMGEGRELFAVTKSGTEIPIEVSLSPIQTDEGLLVSAAIRDDTHRREAEALLTEARVVAENATLTKTRFLAAASHDLRQPLQSLGLYLSALARMVEQPREVEVLGKMRGSLDSMAEILEVLLDISKLESGSVEPVVKVFPLQTLFDSLNTIYATQAREKQLTWHCEATTLTVESDPALLQRIISNLVQNAIKYTDEGSVEVVCNEDGATVRIEVRDTGIGIAEELVGLVFEEYYQVDNDARDRARGLGLGLSIVKYLTTLLDHPVRVSSTPGKGSVFSIEVPLREAALQDDESCVDCCDTQIDRSEISVLYVDDDPAIIDGIVELFQMVDMELHSASDGDEALAQIDGGLVPDFLVSDFRLPKYDGLELVRRVRDRLGRSLPSVIMTGNPEMSQSDCAGLMDCRLFRKPMDFDALLHHIKSEMARAR